MAAAMYKLVGAFQERIAQSMFQTNKQKKNTLLLAVVDYDFRGSVLGRVFLGDVYVSRAQQVA